MGLTAADDNDGNEDQKNSDSDTHAETDLGSLAQPGRLTYDRCTANHQSINQSIQSDLISSDRCHPIRSDPINQ